MSRQHLLTSIGRALDAHRRALWWTDFWEGMVLTAWLFGPMVLTCWLVP